MAAAERPRLPGPPGTPRGTLRFSRGRLRLQGTLPSESASCQTASDVNTNDHQAAAAGAHQLRAGFVAFASSGEINNTAGVHVSAGLTRPHDGADDGGIDSLLRDVRQGQPVRNNFDAAVVGNRHIDGHVRNANVAGDPRSGFLTHPRHHPLEKKGSRCEHTGCRTCSPVVTEADQAAAAGARARCDGQRQVKRW